MWVHHTQVPLGRFLGVKWGAISTRLQKGSPWGQRRHMTYKPSKSVKRWELCTRGNNKKRHEKKPDSGKLTLRPDHPRCRSAIWICVCGHIPEVVIHSKFYRNRFKGFGATRCRNLPFLIDMASGLYTTAGTTVWAVMICSLYCWRESVRSLQYFCKPMPLLYNCGWTALKLNLCEETLISWQCCT